MFGLSMGELGAIARAIREAWSPSTLFAANEPGVWYDPYDLSTLYQDSAGTTPVTAVEQPVGLMLDKSKGLVLGPELVTNGTFDTDTSGWTAGPAGAGVTLSVVNQRLRLTKTGSSGFGSAVQRITGLDASKRYRFSCNGYVGTADVRVLIGGNPEAGTYFNGAQSPVDVAPLFFATGVTSLWITVLAYGGTGAYAEFDNISVRELPGNHASQPTATSRPVLSARVNQYLATETIATQNVTTLAAQYRLSFEGTGTITLSGTATGVYSAGSHLITCTAGTLTSTVSGSVTKADLRAANTGAGLPAYQRVNTATDYDTVGFPHYLRFDGVDDWLVTPTITPGTDKAQVFAGVRKVGTATFGTIVELGANSSLNPGGVAIFGPGDSATNYRFRSSGSIIGQIDTPNIYASPITNTLTGLGDIFGDTSTLRVNGSQAAQSASDQGTGNFLAYPLYIGRRGGTSLPFSGHLYGLIVRLGANLPIETIEKTEKYINQKTRAY